MSRDGDGSDTEVWTSSDGQMPEGSFHLATIMFRRVLQLKAGARPRVDAANHKQGHVAWLEVRAGTIPWEIGLPVPRRSQLGEAAGQRRARTGGLGPGTAGGLTRRPDALATWARR